MRAILRIIPTVAVDCCPERTTERHLASTVVPSSGSQAESQSGRVTMKTVIRILASTLQQVQEESLIHVLNDLSSANHKYIEMIWYAKYNLIRKFKTLKFN